ncbi:MAG: four helix bundle suffix domain-containing protein [Armatimonadetes bacterium]|nr:four helix bundle suffix domain-containing protein [Armatimonadota bacterium]MDE2206435.1 four helix bundle suffix domain-containing protein [Armatimonadota bacterium]
MRNGFIPKHGGYNGLLSYRKAELVYDCTYHFCSRFLPPRSRTGDQMTQAARSGKQNIIEGSMASGTSRETEIKLTGVARASLEELLADYHDFIRLRRFRLWDKCSWEAQEVRRLGAMKQAGYEVFAGRIESDDGEQAANTVICLIHQATYLLDQQLRRQEADFLAEGGLRERMRHARHRRRDEPSDRAPGG